MSQTVEVRFKGTRKEYFLWEDGEAPLRDRRSGPRRGRARPRPRPGHRGGRRGREEVRRQLHRLRRRRRPRPRPRRPSRSSGAPPATTSGCTTRTALDEDDARRKVHRAGPHPRPGHEGERHRVAVGPEQAHHLLHRREAGRLPRAGARPGFALPHPHRAAADRRPRRGRPALRRRPVRPRVLLQLLAHRAVARQPRPRQGPAPLAQSQPDLRRVRPPALLPQVRARVLRHGPPTLPEGRQDCSRRRAAPSGSSRWTSSASGSSSGARSTARGSSRWCNCARRSRPGATCSARPSPGAGWRWRRSHLSRRRWRTGLRPSTSCPSTWTARRARGPPRPRRRAAARPRREAHRTDAGGGGIGGTRATTRRHRPEARGP